MRLDHLSYACSKSDLADTVQRIGSDLGATFSDGGRHPSFGTRNFTLPLGGGAYIEVVAALDHPAADKAPFGRAVSARTEDGGGWLSWVVAVDDLDPVEKRLGRTGREGHRIRPDGVELQWKQLGVLDVIEDPALPFFVEWVSPIAEHPSRGAGAVSIARIEMSGDAEAIAAYLGEPADHPLDDVEVTWVESEERGIVAVWFDTPHGAVRID
jgi:hypothetical protein